MNKNCGGIDITVIGGAVQDILAGPVNPSVFETGSMPMEFIKSSYGGDALNEAVVLSKLGVKTELVTKIGRDDVGDRICRFLDDNKVHTENVTVSDEYPSSINIVLIDENGERYFLTNPSSCLRKLSEKDILPYVNEMADIVSFASIFVSPMLDTPALERVFKAIKDGVPGIIESDDSATNNEAYNSKKDNISSKDNSISKNLASSKDNSINKNLASSKDNTCGKNNAGSKDITITKHGKILLTDMTKPKNGEKLENLSGCLHYIDFFLANESEAAMLTDCSDAYENASRIVNAGAGCAVIKCGSKGCIIKTLDEYHEIPSYPGCKVVDTTGAGDSFAAGFLYGLSRGFSLEDCGRFACAVASCVVEKVGGSESLDSIDEPMRRFEQIKLL